MNIKYKITGADGSHGFGILGKDSTGHSAVTMPFLKDKAAAERLVSRLNELQMPVSDFCDRYIRGELDIDCDNGEDVK